LKYFLKRFIGLKNLMFLSQNFQINIRKLINRVLKLIWTLKNFIKLMLWQNKSSTSVWE